MLILIAQKKRLRALNETRKTKKSLPSTFNDKIKKKTPKCPKNGHVWGEKHLLRFSQKGYLTKTYGFCVAFSAPHAPQIFKLSSGEPKVIQLVTWYHVLFLGPLTIHFLFQITRNIIRLSVLKLQTHLTPPPVSRQLNRGGGCSTGTKPFKEKEKNTVDEVPPIWKLMWSEID